MRRRFADMRQSGRAFRRSSPNDYRRVSSCAQRIGALATFPHLPRAHTAPDAPLFHLSQFFIQPLAILWRYFFYARRVLLRRGGRVVRCISIRGRWVLPVIKAKLHRRAISIVLSQAPGISAKRRRIWRQQPRVGAYAADGFCAAPQHFQIKPPGKYRQTAGKFGGFFFGAGIIAAH